MVAKVNGVHLIGIGGIGISALARYFLSEGWQVSGSDLSPSDTTKELKKEGVRIYIGKHSEKNLRSFASIRMASERLVVYNQAIPTSNIELQTAKLLGIPCQTYPEAVGELTKKYKTIAIAGAHGKSTTTALVSLILIEAGFDPTVIIGTKLKEFSPSVIARSRRRRGNLSSMESPHSARDDSYGVNFRKGKSDWLVLEADEWKASFLNYFPTLAVITNIDKEHLDFYKTFANVKKTFEKFKKRCGKVLTAETSQKIASEIKGVLQIPGKHNIQNALNAYSIAKYLKIPHATILKAISKYRGAWRRMEFKGYLKIENCKSKIAVFDDYAHHPTEIKATLSALKNWPRPLHGRGSPFGKKAAKNALICVFQAHQVQRLKLLFNDFKSAFKAADKVVILPTYEVTGRENTVISNSKLVSEKLSEKLARVIGAIYIKNPKKELKKRLKSLITNYHLPVTIVMMGAGDIVNLTPLLIKNLRKFSEI